MVATPLWTAKAETHMPCPALHCMKLCLFFSTGQVKSESHGVQRSIATNQAGNPGACHLLCVRGHHSVLSDGNKHLWKRGTFAWNGHFIILKYQWLLAAAGAPGESGIEPVEWLQWSMILTSSKKSLIIQLEKTHSSQDKAFNLCP